MSSPKENHTHANQHEQWLHAMRCMHGNEQRIFLKELLLKTEDVAFSTQMTSFLSAASNDSCCGIKGHLEDIALETDLLSSLPQEALFNLTLGYHNILYYEVQNDHPKTKEMNDIRCLAGVPEIPFLPDKSADVMAKYLEGFHYPDILHEQAACQSTVINCLAMAIAPSENEWPDYDLYMQAHYLTKISHASDYVLLKKGIYTSDLPRQCFINIVPYLRVDGIKCRGVYSTNTDDIEIKMGMSLAETISVLKHEKAHQLSFTKTKNVPGNNLHLKAQRLSNSAESLFKKNAGREDLHKVYWAEPEERFARSAQSSSVFGLVKETDMIELNAFFSESPPEFNFVRTAFKKISLF